MFVTFAGTVCPFSSVIKTIGTPLEQFQEDLTKALSQNDVKSAQALLDQEKITFDPSVLERIFEEKFLSSIKGCSQAMIKTLVRTAENNSALGSWVKTILIKVRDAEQNNLLHLLFARFSDEAFCANILRLGIDIDSQNKEQETPLFIVCKQGHKAVCELLLKNKADVNKPSCTGDTPLHAAIGKQLCEDFFPERTAIVDLLINHGAEVNAVNNVGETAMHILAIKYVMAI